MAASMPNMGLGGVVYGSKMLITVAGCMVIIGCIIRGCSERVQDLGQHIKVRCNIVQLTLGLCALCQSVPRMILWSPMVMT
jgi:hypothetical protein